MSARLCVLLVGWGLGLNAGGVFSNATWGQPPKPQPSVLPSAPTQSDNPEVQAIARILDRFEEHSKRLEALQKEYQELLKILQQTETAAQQIQALGNLKQQEMFLSSMFAAQLGDYLWQQNNNNNGNNNNGNNNNGNNNNGNNNNGPRPPRPPRDPNRDYNNWLLAQQQSMANYDAFLKSRELAGLSLELQNAMRQRGQAVNAILGVQQKYREWMLQTNAYFEELWAYVDLDGHRAKQDSEEILSMLRSRGEKLPAAHYLGAMCELRLGRNDQALTSFDRAQSLDGMMFALCSMGRALVQHELDDKRAARGEMQNAFEADGQSPRIKWLRALLLANQEDYAPSLQILESLIKLRDSELAANRTAVLVIACKKKQTKKDIENAKRYAEKGMKLSGEEDWYSWLIDGVSKYLDEDMEGAKASLAKAKELAPEGEKGFCDETLAQFDKADPDKRFTWNFVRR